MRKEKDALGEVLVPEDRYYGAQTQRAYENFKIGSERIPVEIIRAHAIVKKAAATVNHELGELDKSLYDAIQQASDEVIEGKFDAHFPLVIWQSGSGTQFNMNVNEVIANRAIEILGGDIGSKSPVHPNDHVNMGQSTNDTVPTSIHIAAMIAIHRRLFPAINAIKESLNLKAEAFEGIVKIGRTHLQDATPLTLGQEFSGYVAQLSLAAESLAGVLSHLEELCVGGTAVGTGLNTVPKFDKMVCEQITSITGHCFRPARNKFAAMAAHDAIVETSGVLKMIAAIAMKIANDIRWLGSGPRTGFYEIALPSVQPGSSIMPGKVNPVMSEMLTMVCAQVMGNDVAVNIGGASGNFELNVYLPLMAMNLLDSVRLLANGARTYADRCVEGLVANEDRCRETVEKNLAICTSLAPAIGYDKAAAISKHAFKTGQNVRDVAKEWGVLPEKEIDRLLDFHAMTVPESE